MARKDKNLALGFDDVAGTAKEETNEGRNQETKETRKEENNLSSNEEKNIPSKQDSNVATNEEKKKTTSEEKFVRKRVSFDIRTDLHKQLKMKSLLDDRNIYELIEEAVEEYLKKS